MILQCPLRQGIPLASGHFSLELLIPDLVLVFIQPSAQFAQFSAGETTQLLGNFLDSVHPGLLLDINNHSQLNDILMW
jgi:hypothetical protein